VESLAEQLTLGIATGLPKLVSMTKMTLQLVATRSARCGG
jgi:hypothetical protein